MTKTLLTKIIIGVLATGTVGTVGLVVASKNPTTAQAVKSVPVIAKYVDIVTFNKGLNEDEFKIFMDRAKYLEEPKIKEWKEQHGINNSYNNPDIYSIDQMINGDNDSYDNPLVKEFVNWYNEDLYKYTSKIMKDMYSRASAEQIKAFEDKNRPMEENIKEGVQTDIFDKKIDLIEQLEEAEKNGDKDRQKQLQQQLNEVNKEINEYFRTHETTELQ